jgi:hypothetical protein
MRPPRAPAGRPCGPLQPSRTRIWTGTSSATRRCSAYMPTLRDSDGTHHSHHLKGLGLLLRPWCELPLQVPRNGDGPVPECSISDLPGATRVPPQAPQGHGALVTRAHIDPVHSSTNTLPARPVRPSSRATPMKGQHGADMNEMDR